MFLEATLRFNPELVSVAAWLHRMERIRPNTYVIDVDAVKANAIRIALAARSHGLQVYAMTKQFGRNPRVMDAIAEGGIPQVVAVDVEEARTMRAAGHRIGHVGHLVACARSEVSEVLDLHPEVVTVFNLEQALAINEEAWRRGIQQDILLRIYDPANYFHPGQHGGFLPSQLDSCFEELQKLQSVRVIGVTAHPCLYYDYETGQGGTTGNLITLQVAYRRLRNAGFPVCQLNAPGVSCCATFPLLEKEGVTHAEPGSAFTGSTPLHAFGRQPEVPAMVYVTEVSHFTEGYAHTFGGGFYARGHVKEALIIGPDGREKARLSVEPLPPEAIDYYGMLRVESAKEVQVGDTAVYAFRTQIFVTRALVVPVAGISKGKPVPQGTYDARGRQLEG